MFGRFQKFVLGMVPAVMAAGLFAISARAGDIYVPVDFSTIQAAINAANPGDQIHLAAGHYNEALSITNSLTLIGSGTNNCVVHCITNIPIITINGPASVTLADFEVIGGYYISSNSYAGLSPWGITATNATLTLDTVTMNEIINYFVTVVDGSLYATNVSIWTRNILAGCDVGLELKGCTGAVVNLRQDAGHLDHTININDPPAHHSDLWISGCTIRGSMLDYGNCIRTYVDSRVTITNCFLYRSPADAVPAFPAFNHNGIGVNGYSNVVLVTGNVITNLPWAMYCVGSLGANQVCVENNAFLHSTIGGVVWDAMAYRGIDLGGGNLGSAGGNVFSELPAPLTNYFSDVLVTNLNGFSTATIFALHNSWSNPTNHFSVICDKLHVPAVGRVISDDLVIQSTASDSVGRPVLAWNERNAGEQYTVQCSADLVAGVWSNSPGSWPILNPGTNDMAWTNSVAVAAPLFYRISSLVP